MYLDKVFIKHPNICIIENTESVCVFPFLGKKLLKIKKCMQNSIERTLPYCKLKVIFKSTSETINHFHFKYVLPKKLCCVIVYSFKFNSYSAIYYGKTKRHFYVRAAEHMGISHLTKKRLKNVKQSAISDHLLTCDCNINFNDYTILSKDSNNINLLINENLIIARDKPILYKTAESFPLELLYNILIVLFNKHVCNI